MKRSEVAVALQELAADHLAFAADLDKEGRERRDENTEFMRAAWEAQERYSAGVCIAAVNHLNGVSTE